MAVRPALIVDSGCGVSTRAEVLIGASVAQSRLVQYACCAAYVVSVSFVSHFVAPT